MAGPLRALPLTIAAGLSVAAVMAIGIPVGTAADPAADNSRARVARLVGGMVARAGLWRRLKITPSKIAMLDKFIDARSITRTDVLSKKAGRKAWQEAWWKAFALDDSAFSHAGPMPRFGYPHMGFWHSFLRAGQYADSVTVLANEPGSDYENFAKETLRSLADEMDSVKARRRDLTARVGALRELFAHAN